MNTCRLSSYYEKFANGDVKCIDDEIPFDIPRGWEWCRLGTLMATISDGTHKTPHYTSTGIPFLSVQNISSGQLDLEKAKYISPIEHKKLCERIAPTKGDILLCRIGTLGKAIKVYWDFEFSVFVSLGVLRPVSSDVTDYIVTFINSPLGFKWIQSVKVGGGTHTYKINLGDIPRMLICIPPLAEQRRISERLLSLNDKVDKYGLLQKQLENLNEEIGPRLKKSILQVAIRGKLVSQDPTEEPASMLLNRITKEKQKLLREGKIKKKDLVESLIFRGEDNKYYEKVGEETVEITDEIPFDLPESWSWCRLKQCSEVLYGYPFDSQRFNEIGIGKPVIRIRNVIPGTTNTFTDEPCESRYQILPGDMLVGMDGVFNVQFWKGTPALLNQRVCRITASSEIILQRFLYYYLPIAFVEIEKGVSFVTVKHLSDKHLTYLLIPIPPKQEQKRIIDRIDELTEFLK